MASDERIEERVRRAVIAAAEGLDGPDRNRLARIEQELLRRAPRRRPRRWRWALVGIGLAAGAAAAYWGVHRLAGPGTGQSEDPPAGDAGANAAGDSAAAPRAHPQNDDREPDGDDGPIIYIGQ